MMTFTSDTIWPIRLDLSPLECRQILREKELLCYSDVISVLRAQGPLSDEKKSVLLNLQKLFSISDERHKAELRRAANNEKLATIAEKISGFDAYAEWAALGALKIPPTLRPIPRTIYTDEACQTMATKLEAENDFEPPTATNDQSLAAKHDDAIAMNRIGSKVKPCQTATMSTNTETVKSAPKKGSVSLDYNLHLLSEIATGESTQAVVSSTDCSDNDIKPDLFAIHHQIDDIELPMSLPGNSQSRYSATNHTLANQVSTNQNQSSNIHLTTSAKPMSTIGHDSSFIATSMPVVIGSNNGSQRYVVPRSNMPQTVSVQRHQGSSYMTQQSAQSQSGTFLTLANASQLRSPPSHQLCPAWTAPQQPPQQQLPQQQLYIQNVSSHHGLPNIQHNVGHQTMENLTSLGYTLQQRAVRAEQHQTNNKQNFIVRNLGSQPSMDPERNKRFMVVKGNSGGSSLGPSSKKPKISNPSNRQPGRPPLMPAPSSAYTSRPYVANEIFHTNRPSVSATSSIIDCSSITDSNGLKISSVTSSGNNNNSNNNSNNGNRVPNTVTSTQMRANSYYSVSRGNGAQRTNSGSVVQLGSGSQLRTIDPPNVAGQANAMRPKNVQPVISVVPLSPRVPSLSDTSNASISITSIKGEHTTEPHDVEKDLNIPVKVINKDEVYANIMDRVNPPTMLSLSQSENKTQ